MDKYIIFTDKKSSNYVLRKKKTFTHFECWEQVKMHPTFAPTQPVPPPTYTHLGSPVIEEVYGSEVPTNPSFDEPLFSTPESNPRSSSSPVRPQGVKAAKEARRKGKKVATSSINYNDSLKIIAENQAKQLAIQQTQIELAQKQMAHTHKMQEQAESARKLTEETRIMELNTDIMTPKSKRYFSKRKAAILRRYEEEEAQDEEGNYSGSFSDCYRPERDD